MIWYFFPEVNRVLIMNLIMKRVPTSCSMFCIKFSIFSIVSVCVDCVDIANLFNVEELAGMMKCSKPSKCSFSICASKCPVLH